MDLCEDLIVIVTGAGEGLGRAHALELAGQGAAVVVNDLGVSVDGRRLLPSAADDVATEIRDKGGRATANHDDVATWAGAHRLVDQALDAFGRLDALVCNAGIIRFGRLLDMDANDWQTIVDNHLGGAFFPIRAAAAHWQARAEAGEGVEASVVCTTSQSGLYGMPGFSSYAAAKAGVAALVIVAARELAELGVRVNAIAPRAHTRMLDALGVPKPPVSDDPFDARAPGNVSPFVAFLVSSASGDVTGRVFEVEGGDIAVCEGWRRGPAASLGRRWKAEELESVVVDLLSDAAEPAGVPLGRERHGVFATVQRGS